MLKKIKSRFKSKSISRKKEGRRFTISKKIWGSFLGIGLLFVITIGIFYYSFNKIEASNSELINQRVVIVRNTDQIKLEAVSQINNLRAFLLSGDQSFIKEMEEGNQRLDLLLERTMNLEIRPDETMYVSKMQLFNQSFLDSAKSAVSKQDSNAQVHVISSIADGASGYAKNIVIESQKLGDISQRLVDHHIEKAQEIITQTLVIVLSVIIFTFVLLIAIGWILSRLIVKPVGIMSAAAKEIASGDLRMNTIVVKNNDEIGDLAESFNLMTSNLRDIIQEVGNNAEQVASSAEELSASSEETSKSTEQIVYTIQEVSAGVEKQVNTVENATKIIGNMSRTVNEISENAKGVSEIAIIASDKSSEGKHVIETLVQQMNLISDSVAGLNHVIKGLGEHSKEINHIIEVITGISAQTNLLALNAAIEAARAGEAGKGFAVVAAEVRKLAEQTSKSAQQISSLIGSVQSETGKALQSMEIATQEVESGIGLVNTAGDSFALIRESVNEVTTQIQSVSSAVQEVAVGAEHMVQTMSIVNGISEESAGGMVEVSAATEEQMATIQEVSSSASNLSKMAEKLQNIIGRFKV